MTMDEIKMARGIIGALHMGSSMETVLRGLREHARAMADTLLNEEYAPDAWLWDKLAQGLAPLIKLSEDLT